MFLSPWLGRWLLPLGWASKSALELGSVRRSALPLAKLAVACWLGIALEAVCLSPVARPARSTEMRTG